MVTSTANAILRRSPTYAVEYGVHPCSRQRRGLVILHPDAGLVVTRQMA